MLLLFLRSSPRGPGDVFGDLALRPAGDLDRDLTFGERERPLIGDRVRPTAFGDRDPVFAFGLPVLGLSRGFASRFSRSLSLPRRGCGVADELELDDDELEDEDVPELVLELELDEDELEVLEARRFRSSPLEVGFALKIQCLI